MLNVYQEGRWWWWYSVLFSSDEEEAFYSYFDQQNAQHPSRSSLIIQFFLWHTIHYSRATIIMTTLSSASSASSASSQQRQQQNDVLLKPSTTNAKELAEAATTSPTATTRPPSTEISRDEALASLLTNEDLSDLTLRGTDGILVLAHRCLLASRSPVFGCMLYGQFSEGSTTTVDLGYDGKVLQAIVEYIYTDKIPDTLLVSSSSSSSLRDINNNNEKEEMKNIGSNEERIDSKNNMKAVASWDIDFVRFVVTLIDAANYFALPKLYEKVETLALEQMMNHPTIAILFLAVCGESGEGSVVVSPPDYCDDDAMKHLQDKALELVKKNPNLLLNTNDNNNTTSSISIAQIHPSYVEDILKDNNLPMDEQSCFQLLHTWATAEITPTTTTTTTNSTDVGNDDNNNKKTSCSTNSNDKASNNCSSNIVSSTSTNSTNNWQRHRKRIAAEMINYIDLASIDTLDLSTTVKTSGLVSTDQLCQAYKTQAMRLQKRRRTSFVQWRGGIHWKSTQSKIYENGRQFHTDCLAGPILKTGIHKWSIKLLDGDCDFHCLGVISTRWPIAPTTPLYAQRGGWAFYDACAWHAYGTEEEIYRDVTPRFSPGSTVTFILDLEQPGGGTLTTSIDGNPPFQLFSNMCQDHGVDDGHGFLPAVSVLLGGVEFLGFEDIS